MIFVGPLQRGGIKIALLQNASTCHSYYLVLIIFSLVFKNPLDKSYISNILLFTMPWLPEPVSALVSPNYTYIPLTLAYPKFSHSLSTGINTTSLSLPVCEAPDTWLMSHIMSIYYFPVRKLML